MSSEVRFSMLIQFLVLICVLSTNLYLIFDDKDSGQAEQHYTLYNWKAVLHWQRQPPPVEDPLELKINKNSEAKIRASYRTSVVTHFKLNNYVYSVCVKTTEML